MTLNAVRRNTQETTEGRKFTQCRKVVLLFTIGGSRSLSTTHCGMRIETADFGRTLGQGDLSGMTVLYVTRSRKPQRSQSARRTPSNWEGFDPSLFLCNLTKFPFVQNDEKTRRPGAGRAGPSLSIIYPHQIFLPIFVHYALLTIS